MKPHDYHKDFFIKLEKGGIEAGYGMFFIKEKDGMYSWFIPAYNIHFCSKTIEEGEKRGSTMINSFLNYWIGQKGFRSFIMHITRLGFTPKNFSDFQKLLKRQLFNEKIKAKVITLPDEFKDAEISIKLHEYKLSA